MTLILVLGNLNIPLTSIDIPQQFKKLLVPGKIQQILCTGNLNYKNTAIMEYLRTISSEIVLVPGVNDSLYATAPIQNSKALTVGSFRIGLINGYQLVPWNDAEILGMHARAHSLDLLITGHSNKFDAYESDNVIYVNPGSITAEGVEGGVPSFVLMDVNMSIVTIYVYQLVQGSVVVEKLEFTKK